MESTPAKRKIARPPRLVRAVPQEYFAEFCQPFGKVGEDFRGHFAAGSARTQDSRECHAGWGFGGHYSRISSVRRFLTFIPAAPRIVRMDLAVRPCRPITLPRSVG